MSDQNTTTTPQLHIVKRRRGQRLSKDERAKVQEVFLDSFKLNANVTVACLQAGIDRSQIYRWQEVDTEFSFKFKQAELAANDMLLAAAWRRGVQGYEKPVVSMGKQVFVEGKNGKMEPLMERVYSDSLLSLLMKARMSEFRDKSSVDVTSTVTHQGQLTLNTRDMTDSELQQLKQIAMEMRKREEGNNA